MPIFSNKPPDSHGSNNLQILRTPAKGNLYVICLSESVLGSPTHYFNGRTVPHEELECEPCSLHISWRWHSYTVVQEQPTQQMFLLELTAQATEPLLQIYEQLGGLRGVMLELTRRGEKRNGRVIVHTAHPKPRNFQLLDPPNQIDVLFNLWGLDPARAREYKSIRRQDAVSVNPGNDRVKDGFLSASEEEAIGALQSSENGYGSWEYSEGEQRKDVQNEENQNLVDQEHKNETNPVDGKPVAK